MRHALWPALLLLSACGAAEADGSPPDGGLEPRCEMGISTAPQNPIVGDVVDVDGAISKQDVQGIETYTFTVDGPPGSNPQPRMRAPGDDSLIEFDADVVGTYRIELRGEVDGLSCTDAVLNIFASDPTADTTPYRFRFVPGALHGAPPQDKVFNIPDSPDFPLNVVGLDTGMATAGVVDDGAAGFPAYLRFTRTFDDATSEAFAGTTGNYEIRLLAGAYDILVVPQAGVRAPALLADVTAASALDLSLPASDDVSGTVLDGAGQPIEGAQVAMRIAGVPTTIATTDAAGDFAVAGHAGADTSIVVTPPESTGLPRLELAPSAALTTDSSVPLAIQYAAGLTSRVLSLAIVDTDGSTPLPDAVVTLVMRPAAAAGTVTPQAGSALDAAGSHRFTVEADGSGQISLTVPDGIYDAIVRPPGASSGVRLLELDLSAGQATPASLSLAAPARLTGRVLEGVTGVAGARVSAAPRGALASEPAAAAMATTAADGSYTLEVVGGGQYDVVVVPPVTYARSVMVDVQAPVAGAQSSLGDLVVTEAAVVTGKVAIAGVGQPGGVTVQVFCSACTGTAAQIPLAEAVSSNDGSFVVSIPRPQAVGGP